MINIRPAKDLRREQSMRISLAQEEPGCSLPPHDAPAPDEQAICEAYEQGLSADNVAREFSTTRCAVDKILKSNGVAIRPRGGGDNSHIAAEQKVLKSLRPKHAHAPQFSDAWFRQCDAAYCQAVSIVHPDRGGVRQ